MNLSKIPSTKIGGIFFDYLTAMFDFLFIKVDRAGIVAYNGTNGLML